MSKFIHRLPNFKFNKLKVDELINLSQKNANLKNTFISKNESKDPIVQKQQEAALKNGYQGKQNDFVQIHCSENDFFEPLKEWTGLKNPKASIIVKTPGNMIGWHVDTYFKFRSSCPEYDESEYLPIRFMYFPLQHQNGHAFSVEKEWLTSWEAGTGITWHPNAGHCGTNCGTKITATINVTGLISSKEFKSFNLTDIKNPW